MVIGSPKPVLNAVISGYSFHIPNKEFKKKTSSGTVVITDRNRNLKGKTG